MAAKNWAIIAGVGPGLGASLARKFSQSYKVALLARNPKSYDPIVEDIKAAGNHAIGISTDTTKPNDVQKAFATLKEQLNSSEGGNAGLAVAIYNVGGELIKKPFEELEADEYEAGWRINGLGAFLFAKQAVPLLIEHAKQTNKSTPQQEQNAPTLLFTSATAGLRGSAQVASYSGGKFAMRSLAQSLGREYGPSGLHVAQVLIDGVIDAEGTKDWLTEHPDAKLSPDAIADVYWHLHSQHRSCFTSELDLRPYIEKW